MAVYFIRAANDTGSIKIGKSDNVIAHLNNWNIKTRHTDNLVF